MLALLKGSDIDRGRRLAWRRRRLNLDAGQATRVSALLGLALVAGLTAILASPLYPGDASIAAGRPAPRDFQAPRAITFPSEILTEQKRQKAAEGVAPIYAAPNPNVAGQQTDKASQVLDYVELQRQDTHGDRAAHIAWSPTPGTP
jgi:membrane-associated HD superfamily phosphohydrolase